MLDMTLARIRQSNPEFRDAELVGAQIRIRGGLLTPSRGPLSFLEDVLRSLSDQMEFEDNPQSVGDRVIESQRIMQTMMRD